MDYEQSTEKINETGRLQFIKGKKVKLKEY